MRRAVIVIAAAIFANSAAAQALAPMRETFATYADRFAIRLTARNPYKTGQRFSIAVFEADWTRSSAYAVTPSIPIAPGEERSFMVIGATDGEAPRTLYVCVTSEPFASRGSAVRGEVCGKYRILPRPF